MDFFFNVLGFSAGFLLFCLDFFKVPIIHAYVGHFKMQINTSKDTLTAKLSYFTDCCVAQQQQNLQDSPPCCSLEHCLVVKQVSLGG